MKNTILTGDCLSQLSDLEESSIHAIVTDPPYNLDGFMDNEWDDIGSGTEYQKWCEKWAVECLRVLKPGGHLIAFSGNRTHHRLFSGVEDAGFEIRDTLTWHYSQSMPKAHDISKGIDKRNDEFDERPVIGSRETTYDGANRSPETHSNPSADANIGEWGLNDTPHGQQQTKGASETSQQWDGWRTSLKNASEFAVLARKPLSEETVVENVLVHGTGGLNVNGCRITPEGWLSNDERELGEGRYPMNVMFDSDEAKRLDDMVGKPVSTYFYCPKAPASERTLNGLIDSDSVHPTQKPFSVMEWLVTMVAAEGQIVLDPFCGSGTTCDAAHSLGREFIGIEMDDWFADIARARCGLTVENPSRFSDEEQSALSMFSNGD